MLHFYIELLNIYLWQSLIGINYGCINIYHSMYCLLLKKVHIFKTTLLNLNLSSDALKIFVN